MRVLGWAAFLGCSWTWCIGMFLPVLLVRDLGIWGWIVFAVPNVIGATAMGWVLTDAAQSRLIVEMHRGAAMTFSAVTIAFHVFFILWFVPRLVGLPIAAVTFAITGFYLLLTARRGNLDLTAGAITLVVSAAMFALFVSRGAATIPDVGRLPATGAAWLGPVCIFGFALCPYLDLTFHRARQSLGASEARVSFALGFGVCFLAMILFSLLYASALSPLVGEHWRQHLRPIIGSILATHMIAQTAFTLAIHTRAFAASRPGPGAVFGVFVLAQAALLLALGSYMMPRYRGMDGGELIYRLFMGCYGLIFPAYVWICMIPRRGAQVWPTAVARAFLLAVLIAAPMFWMGFIESRLQWLVPGLAAVVLARYSAPRRAYDRPGHGSRTLDAARD